MPDDRIGSDTPEHRSVGQRVKRSVETHVVIPLAVTVVSAATHYLIRKLPLLLEEKVLPKLREQGSAEGVRGSVAETAVAVTERVVEVVPGLERDETAPTTSRPTRRQPSNDEREQERKRREQRRGERRRAVQKA
jgi:hypothetical protein